LAAPARFRFLPIRILPRKLGYEYPRGRGVIFWLTVLLPILASPELQQRLEFWLFSACVTISLSPLEGEGGYLFSRSLKRRSPPEAGGFHCGYIGLVAGWLAVRGVTRFGSNLQAD